MCTPAVRHPRRQGFTLTETVAAVVILSIAIPPMLFAIRRSALDRADVILSSRAHWLATERLEDVIADRFSAARGYDYVESARYPNEAPITGDDGFNRRVRVRETGPDLITAGAGYKVVTVNVDWTNSKEQDCSLEVSTVLADWDL